MDAHAAHHSCLRLVELPAMNSETKTGRRHQPHPLLVSVLVHGLIVLCFCIFKNSVSLSLASDVGNAGGGALHVISVVSLSPATSDKPESKAETVPVAVPAAPLPDQASHSASTPDVPPAPDAKTSREKRTMEPPPAPTTVTPKAVSRKTSPKASGVSRSAAASPSGAAKERSAGAGRQPAGASGVVGTTGATGAAAIDTEAGTTPQTMGTPSRPFGNSNGPGYARFVPPVYPAMARRNGIGGLVLLRARILADGTASDVAVLESAHSSLNSAAIDSVRKSLFTPLQVNATPMDCWTSIPIRFTLVR